MFFCWKPSGAFQIKTVFVNLMFNLQDFDHLAYLNFLKLNIGNLQSLSDTAVKNTQDT